METDMLHSAAHALLIILDPTRMLYLFGGVCMGLSLGILPGIGGVAGTALLLPFTYNLDPPTAFAARRRLRSPPDAASPALDPARSAADAIRQGFARLWAKLIARKTIAP